MIQHWRRSLGIVLLVMTAGAVPAEPDATPAATRPSTSLAQFIGAVRHPYPRIGNARMRFFVAAYIALQIAGASGGIGGSPTPLGASELSTV